MNEQRQPLLIAVLLLAVALTGWWVWTLREREEPAPLVGPPRSDYQVEQFELMAFDEAGAESFSLRGPRLSRHPYLGTLDIEQPRLRMPDQDGALWQGRSTRAWVSREADLVRMLGAVELVGPRPEGETPLRFRSELLELLPKENKARTELAVTVTGPGSILRGTGMRAELDARRVELLSEVTARYEDIAR